MVVISCYQCRGPVDNEEPTQLHWGYWSHWMSQPDNSGITELVHYQNSSYHLGVMFKHCFCGRILVEDLEWQVIWCPLPANIGVFFNQYPLTHWIQRMYSILQNITKIAFHNLNPSHIHHIKIQLTCVSEGLNYTVSALRICSLVRPTLIFL